MKRFVSLLMLSVFLLSACSAQKGADPDFSGPTGEFVSWDETADFDIVPKLRILPDPDRPGAGIAGISITITTKSKAPFNKVNLVAWLPQEIQAFTWLDTLNTEGAPGFQVNLTPDQPSTGVVTRIKFDDYADAGELVEAFVGAPLKMRISWAGGERRYAVPGSRWTVEVVTGN